MSFQKNVFLWSKALYQVWQKHGVFEAGVRILEDWHQILGPFASRLKGFPKGVQRQLMSELLTRYSHESAIVVRSLEYVLAELGLEFVSALKEMLLKVNPKDQTLGLIEWAHSRPDFLKQVEKISGDKIRWQVYERPERLGGVVLRVGDWVLDGSLEYNLKRLKKQLLGD